MQKKVSIVTPCYNGESYIKRMLDSVLNQDYDNIEFIFINDGSTDKTEKIVKSYEKKFKKRGYEFIYIYQENGGQANAVNKGLKLFTGDYLTWPDSDDMLSKNSISKKVAFLEKNKQYQMVRTDAKVVNENNLNKTIGHLSKKREDRFKEDLFDDFILENNVWFAPGCFMITREIFLKCFPNRQIIESRTGQNWQILLPISLNNKWGYIDKDLYTYVVRDSSHSHSIFSIYDKKLKHFEEQEKLLNQIIDTLDVDKKKYKNMIEKKYLNSKMIEAYNIKNKEDYIINYNKLKNKYDITFMDRMRYLRIKYDLFDKFISKIRGNNEN